MAKTKTNQNAEISDPAPATEKKTTTIRINRRTAKLLSEISANLGVSDADALSRIIDEKLPEELAKSKQVRHQRLRRELLELEQELEQEEKQKKK